MYLGKLSPEYMHTEPYCYDDYVITAFRRGRDVPRVGTPIGTVCPNCQDDIGFIADGGKLYCTCGALLERYNNVLLVTTNPSEHYCSEEQSTIKVPHKIHIFEFKDWRLPRYSNPSLGYLCPACGCCGPILVDRAKHICHFCGTKWLRADDQLIVTTYPGWEIDDACISEPKVARKTYMQNAQCSTKTLDGMDTMLCPICHDRVKNVADGESIECQCGAVFGRVDDMYKIFNIDRAFDNITKQAIKHKTYMEKPQRSKTSGFAIAVSVAIGVLVVWLGLVTYLMIMNTM